MDWDGDERRNPTFCDKHSGVCVRLTHVEEDVQSNKKKLDKLIILMVAALTGIAANLLLIIVKMQG
jgi:hypothetical protein